MLTQDGFDRRLSKDHRRRVAERIRWVYDVDTPDKLAIGAEVLRGRERRGVGKHILSNIQILQHAQYLVVDSYCAGDLPDGLAFVHDECPYARLAKP